MNMSSISCPFCGEVMDSPLKFCVACGRAITESDLKHAGLKLQQGGRRSETQLAAISRRDFSFQRKFRSFMYTLSAILTVLIGYYVVMKFVLHEHIPGNLDAKIEELIGVQPATTAPAPAEETAAKAPTPAKSPDENR